MEFRSHLTVALRVIGRDGEVAIGVRTAPLELLREQPDLIRCPLRAVNGGDVALIDGSLTHVVITAF
jgi:hypothetical protein